MPEGRTLVVGLGKTGLSCARYLAEHGVDVGVTDSRAAPPGLQALRDAYPRMPVHIGGFDAAEFEAARCLLVSPGVSVREPLIAAAAERGVPVWGDIELFARRVTAPVVAITGTNGKSTVTTLFAEMAKACGWRVAVGGNLGTPALDLLEQTDAGLFVMELSSFQLETTHSLNAAAAVVLNVSADHLDRYTGVEDYAATKARIYDGDGVMVLNRDDARVMRMARPGRSCLRFGLDAPRDEFDFGVVAYQGESWLAFAERRLMPVKDIRMAGLHNVSNALAALALAQALRLDLLRACHLLTDFAGLAHRGQWVAEIDGVTYYNDSKGTNVGATVAALRGMPGQLILIAGGEGKHADFTPLAEAARGKVRRAVLIGRDAGLIEQVLRGVVDTMHASDMFDAVNKAREAAEVGDSVLLSPACASFDMFNNFEHRGDVFIEAVRGLRA